LKSTSTEAVLKTFSRTRKAIITLHISFFAFLKPEIEHFLLVLFVFSLLEKLAQYPIFSDIGGQVGHDVVYPFTSTPPHFLTPFSDCLRVVYLPTSSSPL
jgi:hypothetical protein